MLRERVELLTTAQVARRLKQSEEVVRRKARNGTLPALRLGASPRAPLRFDSGDLELWLIESRLGARGARAMRELTQAEMDAIDESPLYGSRTAGRILHMGEPLERRSRKVPPWKLSAARREYRLLLMRARLEMEEVL
jgi:excisionase family DNA binding protein